MQLTDEFASTFEAGDWIEYTDDRGNRLSGTLVTATGADRDAWGDTFGLSALGWFVPVVIQYLLPDGEATHFFDSRIAKLHSFRRARRRVVVGDHLDGIEERLIVPTATQVLDSLLGLYVWSGSGEWIQVEGTEVAAAMDVRTLRPSQIRGEVVVVP